MTTLTLTPEQAQHLMIFLETALGDKGNSTIERVIEALAWDIHEYEANGLVQPRKE